MQLGPDLILLCLDMEEIKQSYKKPIPIAEQMEWPGVWLEGFHDRIQATMS